MKVLGTNLGRLRTSPLNVVFSSFQSHEVAVLGKFVSVLETSIMCMRAMTTSYGSWIKLDLDYLQPIMYITV